MKMLETSLFYYCIKLISLQQTVVAKEDKMNITLKFTDLSVTPVWSIRWSSLMILVIKLKKVEVKSV